MLNNRSPLILGAVLTGTAVAAALWLLLGPHAPSLRRLDDLQGRLAAAKRLTVKVDGEASVARGPMPLFTLTTGAGAVTDVTVRVDGVAISARRTAALVAINGKPADWLTLGATRDGVTLVEVHPTIVRLDTAAGFKDVSLGAGPPAADAATAPEAAGSSAARPGFQPSAVARKR